MPEPRRPRVLVVDDKREMAETVADGLSDRGYEALALYSSHEALERMKAESFDALVTDLRMPEIDGIGLLSASRTLDPERPVLVMTAFGAVDSAIQSIRDGAYHYLTKPFKMDELALFLDRALKERSLRADARALKRTLRERDGLAAIVGRSAGMQGLLDIIERVAPTDAPVLLLGETGTGKGLLAHALHALSPRATKRFISVNCAALPEALLESELFGHSRGAFTGATGERSGLFTEADGGTLFLDEIAEMSPSLQAKLLHVLETGAIRPLGSNRELKVDVRVLAATHRDLKERIRAGSFREDLFYRLEVVALEIPALRHRPDDIPILLDHFLMLAKAKHPASTVDRLSPEAANALLDYRWPGNVRELSHLIERLVILGRGPEIKTSDLPLLMTQRSGGEGLSFQGQVVTVRELHHRYASWALGQLGGLKGKAAEQLDIDGKTLSKWLSDNGTNDPPPESPPTPDGFTR